jgi:DNA-binding beta-propeller fold protein YncE
MIFDAMKFGLLGLMGVLGIVNLRGQQVEVPGKLKYAQIDVGGVSTLPSGRFVKPAGELKLITRAPYGLAISQDGRTAVVLHNNAISVVDLQDSEMQVSRYPSYDGKNKDIIKGASFIGACFSSDNRRVFLSGGDKGKVWVFDVEAKRLVDSFDLNLAHPESNNEAFATDLVLDEVNDDLWVLDRAWFQLHRFSLKTHQIKASIPSGRIPFGIAIAPKQHKVLVANVGMYAYPVVPGVNEKTKDSFLLHFPPYGAHSKESREGVEFEGRFIPGLGDPNNDQSMSVWVVDTRTNDVIAKVKTGKPIGSFLEDAEIVGGAHPNSIVCDEKFAYVSQAGSDDIAVIDLKSNRLKSTWPIKTGTFLDESRGYMPYGVDLDKQTNRLYVSLLGFNSVAVLDAKSGKNLGMIPAGWGATRVKCLPNSGAVLITSARGLGAGPNGGQGFVAPPQGTYIGDIQLGSLQRVSKLSNQALAMGRQQVLDYTYKAMPDTASISAWLGPNSPIKHIVYITKENRTYDEVFGQLTEANGDSSLSRFGVNCEYTIKGQLQMIHNDQLWDYGVDTLNKEQIEKQLRGLKITPNHHKIAKKFAFSDNFYCDSDASIHGHHWMMGTMPNEYVETNAANEGDFRVLSPAPGRRMPKTTGAMDPEDYNQIGGLWEAVQRSGKTIYNFGEANEYQGVREDWYDTLNGTGIAVAFPMPSAIYAHTSRNYAGYNTSIPDQFRVEQFETEFSQKWLSGGAVMPNLITIQLPNDHTSKPRPADGYPFVHSYVADNDLALGRMMHFLSHTPYWKNMLVIVTEDDPQGGVDHIDAHRSILMMAGPYVKRNYVSHTHANFGSIIKLIYQSMGIPGVNHFDITATDLSDYFTTVPDFTPYTLEPSDLRVFDPAVALKKYNRTIPWREMKMPETMDDENQQRKDFYENHK